MLSDDSFSILKVLVENRLGAMKQNISVYVERVVQYEQILTELQSAEFVKDLPAAPKTNKEKQAKIKVAANLCTTHKTYTAQRSPRTDCPECWAAYEKMNGKSAAIIVRRAFDRKQSAKNISTI